MTNSNLRSVALLGLLIGVGLVLSPLILFPDAGEVECLTDVRPVAERAIPEAVDIHQYSALSPDAKRVFDEARTADDGETTVHGDRCPEEFTYSDATQRNYVQNGTDYYEVRTSGDTGFKLISIERLVEAGAVLIGILMIIICGRYLRGRD